ncbi:hydrogenase expression/formation protein HypE [Niastella koreensis]|uniref:Hydrogenase expression/formation protein HypE n=2 Tax=Niastella koreensis TaxID=354356 RepID=G8TLQ0_NIAKG|nr:hydrogenase expression/formation protein HypE [Niastella koreensis]AEV97642.1 hydrogenase expression/formation protein HypE [Niastella koreensis GR20-10]OQP40533.1 hydrogenase expression/formation protein HypE [Niastella koreensis]
MQITCPVPVSETTLITMGHGSGGLLTHKLLQAGVFNLLENEWLNQQHDGATLQLNGRVAFSTDSYVVSPIFFPGGNIGDLAVNGTVNDLAMCGAAARYLSLSFIIEEGLPMEAFYTVLNSIARAADAAGVRIVTGDTKVVEKGKGDQLFINTSGIGTIHPRAAIHHHHIKAGDRIIISGPIATHGIAIMSVRKGLEFETTIESDSAPLKYQVLSMLEEYGDAIHFLRDPTRGGVASVLNEVAGLTSLGFTIQQQALPIDEQVEGACEMLGLDPLYVANEGIFLSVVDPEYAEDIVALLHKDGSTQAAVIGEVSTEHPGKVLLRSRIGGHRVVSYLTGEQLPRIC